MALTSGQILQNRYRIASMLGQGGMGAVYRAWDIRLNVSVAVKEMVPQPGLDQQTLTQLRQQFQQEAQILARLVHPYLVRVTDFFEESGNAYLVMDFVEGESLVDRIEREGSLPEPQVLEWTYQLLDALGYCHNQGIIHRDIKPQNVIIRSDGRAVLVDFGLVKLWDPNDPHTRTAMRGMGTPEYAPPEQYDTQVGHTDPRSDIYSLGATIYHALTGQAPPTATMRIANPVLFHKPRTLTPCITSTTENAVLRATELTVGNRFATTQEMAAALRGESVPTPTLVVTPGVPERTKVMPGAVAMPGVQPAPVAERRRRPAWVWAVGGIAIVAVIGGAILLRGRGPDGTSTDGTATAIAIAALEATDTPSPTSSPLPTSTPAPTNTPTPTDAPTNTPAPTRTKPPTSTPMRTPETTLTHTPTSTPTATPTAGTPTSTSTPRPTSAPASGALIDFEQFGTWRRGDQPYGQLTQTQEQVKTGNYAAKLSYDFPASGDDYVVFLRTLNLGGQPNTFGAWVYGDGSGHLLTLWIQDAQDQVWSVYLGKVGSAGWRQMVGGLAPNLPWPSGHISGPNNGVIDYPVRFHALVLDRIGGAQRGQIYIDDISAWQGTPPTVATPAGEPAPTTVPPTAPPPPSGQAGRVFYTIEAGDAYYLGSTDPGWSQGQVLEAIAYNQSTCAGGTRATTLAGQSVNLFYGYRCAVGSPQECPSPDGVHKVVLWEQRGNFSLSIYRVSDNQMLENVYNGSLNRDEPILWAPDSSRFYFTVDHTLHMARPGAAGYQPALSTAYEPYLSPDGSMILYRLPVGTVGAYDVMVANYDGSNQHNMTNAPEVYKLCARWGGY